MSDRSLSKAAYVIDFISIALDNQRLGLDCPLWKNEKHVILYIYNF